MSVSITDYPVKVVGQNVFGGGSPVEVTFKREDLQIDSIEQGADNTIVINISEDITNELNVGEYIYLNDFFNPITAEVLEISSTFIRIYSQWSDDIAANYINYKQNYYLEVETVNTENVNIKILPFTLTNDGKANGEIIFDLAIVNDLNKFEVPDYYFEVLDSQKFNIRYREQWRELSGGAYTFIDSPIIITDAYKIGDVETLTNAFSQPNVYIGYDSFFTYVHSDSDQAGHELLNFYYDELDLNKEAISAKKIIISLPGTWFGRLMARLSRFTEFTEGTEYIDVTVIGGALPEYNPLEYSNEYNIGQ